jgi:hypothetical protein
MVCFLYQLGTWTNGTHHSRQQIPSLSSPSVSNRRSARGYDGTFFHGLHGVVVVRAHPNWYGQVCMCRTIPQRTPFHPPIQVGGLDRVARRMEGHSESPQSLSDSLLLLNAAGGEKSPRRQSCRKERWAYEPFTPQRSNPAKTRQRPWTQRRRQEHSVKCRYLRQNDRQ